MRFGLFILTLLMALQANEARAQLPCSVGSQPALWVASRYRALATQPTLDAVRARSAFQIGVLDSSAVVIVADTLVCRSALEAYSTSTGRDDFGDSVVVVTLGPSRYAVAHVLPADSSRRRPIVVFDTSFTTAYHRENW